MKTIIIALLIAFACSTELNTVEEEQLMFYPDGLLKCLQEAAPYAKDVVEIINLIKNKDFMGAFTKAIALVNAGSELSKRCIQYIVGSEVNLTTNWPNLANCLLIYAESI